MFFLFSRYARRSVFLISEIGGLRIVEKGTLPRLVFSPSLSKFFPLPSIESGAFPHPPFLRCIKLSDWNSYTI